MIWGLSGRFEIASLRDAGVRSYSLTPDCRAEGLHPFGSLSGLSRFSLSEAVEEFPGSLYILTVVWGMSGCPEIASLRDASVRSFSLAPDCSAEGLHPFGSVVWGYRVSASSRLFNPNRSWNITIRNHLRRICLYINVYAIKRKPLQGRANPRALHDSAITLFSVS